MHRFTDSLRLQAGETSAQQNQERASRTRVAQGACSGPFVGKSAMNSGSP